MQQENASAATQKVKEGVSSFLGGISKALVIAPDGDYQLAQIVGGKAVVFDRYKVSSSCTLSNKYLCHVLLMEMLLLMKSGPLSVTVSHKVLW